MDVLLPAEEPENYALALMLEGAILRVLGLFHFMYGIDQDQNNFFKNIT